MQERNIVERIKHPDYKLPSRYNDIALIKFDRPLELTPEVRPACLEVNPLPPGKRAIASGFGKTSYGQLIMNINKINSMRKNYVFLCKKLITILAFDFSPSMAF